ncbi:sensor histidine kinase [Neobacillus sp. MM2021_6]|uniref:sensor histidine kinase n=1 Tax=Bacillaceae TaxID=186817 RepID=UPI00140D5388|nr:MULTISPECIES: sensor histidine kinase [Bacillaceae]MBO0962717.1 sensor histidine kinase [Neobacillus sp. MM2021_6]NHC20382.1 HAMP domain-containing histidine kinase [Bacillus sp. MM2020_4]
MIRDYLIERRSWICLFFVIQTLILFVSYLDSAIPLMPLFYIIFLSMLVFSMFLIFRYHKETRFYKSLAEWENNLDLTTIAEPESPFEKMVEQSIVNQTVLLKKEATENLLMLEQEKDELLAWIHEVKTPLTAMHLMIDRLDNEKTRAQLNHEWLRIHLLLDQQLHQRRIPFMENDLYIEETDLKTLLFKEIKMLQSWCMQKGLGFEVDLEVATVLTDAKWLAFMLRQLLTNAVKYSDSSDILIKSYHKNGRNVLDVTDFGRGIDPKDLSRIFDKGFTSTTSHLDQAATGMGLYLTSRIAKPLLISIAVDSRLGEGTTFTLTFPKRNDFVDIAGM